MQKSRLTWVATLDRVQSQIDVAAANLITRCEEINDDEDSEEGFDMKDVKSKAKALHQKLAILDRRLVQELDDGLNAQTPEARAEALKVARATVEEYAGVVKDNKFLEKLDKSGFPKAKLKETLDAVLKNLAANL
jgi:hypothetical protein